MIHAECKDRKEQAEIVEFVKRKSFSILYIHAFFDVTLEELPNVRYPE